MTTPTSMTDSPAETFKAMATRLERNPPEEFAGAYVIISPKGEVISQAFINPAGDEASFWGFISGAVQTAATAAIQKEEGFQGGMGRRR